MKKMEAFPAAERARRLQSVQRVLRKREIDAVFLTGAVNTAYLLGVSEPSLLYVPKHGRLVRLVSDRSAESEDSLCINRWEMIPHVLGGAGYAVPRRIALEGALIEKQKGRFSDVYFGCEIRAEAVCAEARASKTPWEQEMIITCARQAAKQLWQPTTSYVPISLSSASQNATDFAHQLMEAEKNAWTKLPVECGVEAGGADVSAFRLGWVERNGYGAFEGNSMPGKHQREEDAEYVGRKSCGQSWRRRRFRGRLGVRYTPE